MYRVTSLALGSLHSRPHAGDETRGGPSVVRVGVIDECGSEDIKRAVLLARYTGQRQADVIRMAPEYIEDGGIVVVQQKTGKELWVRCTPI